MSSNTTVIADPDFGEYGDWIELFNDSDDTLNLEGYRIADDGDYTNAFVLGNQEILPQSTLLLWADDHGVLQGEKLKHDWLSVAIPMLATHLDFKLSADGESVFLWDEKGVLLDAVDYPAILQEQSRVNVDGEWSYATMPSPGEYAINPATQVKRLAPVAFSHESGYYSHAFEVILTGEGDSIHYTLDGSIPNLLSPVYHSPIAISKTTVVRAIAVSEQELASTVSSAVFTTALHDLPQIHIAANNEDLFSPVIGIIKESRKDNEVPVYISMLDSVGVVQFSTNAGIELFGSTIYNLPQKPFNISLKGKYGDDLLRYQLFKDQPIYSTTDFVLRNGGNDFYGTGLRDGLLARVANQMAIDYQAYQPIVAYLNGNYYGVYRLRQKMNATTLQARHNLPEYGFDLLEDSLVVKSGKKADFEELLTWVEGHDLADSSNYALFESRVDIPSFIDYFILKSFIGYNTFAANNKFWRSSEFDGKWRWIAFDLEHGLGCCGGDEVTHNTMADYVDGSSKDYSMDLLQAAWTNESFQTQLLNRYQIHLQQTLSESRLIEMINQAAKEVRNEMTPHLNLWNPTQSLANWEAEVEDLKNYARDRHAFLTQVIDSMVPISHRLCVLAYPGGLISVNGIPVGDSVQCMHLSSSESIELSAQPLPGYQFFAWDNGYLTPEIQIDLTSDFSIKAYFVPDSFAFTGTVTDTMIWADTDTIYRIYGDLTISDSALLIVQSGVRIMLEGESNLIVHGGVKMLGTAEQPVNISGDSNQPWGNIILQNAIDTVRFEHVQIQGAGPGLYDDGAAINSLNSKVVVSNCTLTGNRYPIRVEGGWADIRNNLIHMERTGDLIHLLKMDSAVVVNNELRGNLAEDTDGIDLDQIHSALVQGNWIYGLRGFNSDGIDLGEGTNNVSLKDNEIFSCDDKGVSVGQASHLVAQNNVIAFCGQGVGVKDEHSLAELSFNTFYTNEIAVANFQKNPEAGAGQVILQDNLLAYSGMDVWLDEYGTIDSSDNYIGDYANPIAFTNELRFDLNSPLNQGSKLTFNEQRHPDVRINEVFYDGGEGNCYTLDWIEIAGQGYLNNWAIADGSNTSIINLDLNGYALLARDSSALKPDALFDFGLKRLGEPVSLYDDHGMIVGYVDHTDFMANYLDSSAQPIALDEFPLPLVKWRFVPQCAGTPGQENDFNQSVQLLHTRQFSIYPNPCTHLVWIESESAQSVSFEVFNTMGGSVGQGKTDRPFAVSQLPNGLYFVQVGQAMQRLVVSR